ncbi:hypothetical protein [Celeribacter arenosi]|uniref:Adenylosuccinate lyase n=1 Tax=Celeribacter arenosi TaxID=792649 RepID=A0ABP7KCB0_9RHOB
MIRKLVLLFALIAPFGAPALAEGCSHEQRAASCADGLVWNAEKGMCTEQVMG